MKHIYVAVIVPAAVLIPLAAGIVKKSYRYKQQGVIFNYLVFAGLIDIVERILGMNHINNLPLLHFYTIVEYLFILRFFQLALDDPPLTRVIQWLMGLFTIFAIADLLFIQSIYQYNSYPRPVASLVIIGLCMFYFFRQNSTKHQTHWGEQPLNWMVSGLLIYFGSSLFHFAFLNIVYERASLNVYYILGTIHATLVLTMYLLFAIGFFYGKERG